MAFCSMFSVETDRDAGISFCWTTSQKYTWMSCVFDFLGGAGAVFCTVDDFGETDGDCAEKQAKRKNMIKPNGKRVKHSRDL